MRGATNLASPAKDLKSEVEMSKQNNVLFGCEIVMNYNLTTNLTKSFTETEKCRSKILTSY